MIGAYVGAFLAATKYSAASSKVVAQAGEAIKAAYLKVEEMTANK
jgi:hypothetical protein